MHPLLARQLKRLLDAAAVADPTTECDQLRQFLENHQAPASLLSIGRGLGDFLARVEGAYTQLERDLSLRTRSLKLSSEELLATNDQLRGTLEAREAAITQLQALAERLRHTLPDATETRADATDDLTGLVALISRLIERQEAHQAELLALHTDLANQKFALDQHAIVSITDLDGTITYANDRFCDIAGYTRGEILGHTHRLIRSNYHPAQFFADLWGTIQTGNVWRGEVNNRKKNGDDYWVSATIVPLTDASGQPSQYIALRTDITKRKQAERELKKAKSIAETASQAKSEFLANMSHEIRTPMNGIIGMTELALDTDLDPTQRDYLNTVRNSANALLVILNDILDFSKIEAGKLQIEQIPFNLPATITEALKSIGARAYKKGLSLVSDLGADLPAEVLGDPGRLRQVLNNLCDNAIKFTREGTITVTASLEGRDERHNRIHLVVSDTGIGIPEEKQGQIFEAFTQADASTIRKFGGTGLGLAISTRLVDLMGGRIWVESTPGQGSRFHFTLNLNSLPDASAPRGAPRAQDPGTGVPLASGADGATPPTSSDRQVLQPHERGLMILLVEDHPVNQKLTIHLLQKWGHAVTLAQNGQEAVDLFPTATWDLVFMDMQMPVMGGIDATCLIRQGEPPGQHTPIVAMTANARSEDRARCLAAGMDDHLPKPLDIQTLHRLLAHYCHPAASPVPEPAPPASGSAIQAALAAMDPDMLLALREVIRTQLLGDMATAYAAQGSEDWDTLRRAAHNLKNTLGLLGMSDLVEIAKQIEAAPAATPTERLDGLAHSVHLILAALHPGTGSTPAG
jgi:PAS domain S-box-containing protein